MIIGCIVKQAEAVGTNHTHVAEAGKRASAVQKDVETLSEAEFPADHPAFVNILNELAQLNEYAEKWNEKGYWSQRFGISKTGTTKALKYGHLAIVERIARRRAEQEYVRKQEEAAEQARRDVRI